MEENGRKWYQIGCDMVGCDNLSSNADTIATIEFPSVQDSGHGLYHVIPVIRLCL